MSELNRVMRIKWWTNIIKIRKHILFGIRFFSGGIRMYFQIQFYIDITALAISLFVPAITHENSLPLIRVAWSCRNKLTYIYHYIFLFLVSFSFILFTSFFFEFNHCNQFVYINNIFNMSNTFYTTTLTSMALSWPSTQTKTRWILCVFLPA